MSEMKRYAGSCHCGKVRFEVDAKIDGVMACNCSICSRMGWLLIFVPREQVNILAGEAEQTDYQFGKKKAHHRFCPTCGTHAFGHGAAPNGKEMFAVNARCLEGLDVESLPVSRFDGKSL